MMNVRVPAKVVLLGEWAVLDGYPALATTLDLDFTGTWQSSAGETPVVNIVMSGESPKGVVEQLPPFRWSPDSASTEGDFDRRCQQLCAILHARRPWPAGTLALHRGWRLCEGFGSSSASLLAIRTLHQVATLTPPATLPELFADARALNNRLEGVQGSGVDLALQIWGGTASYRIGQLPQRWPRPLPPELVLIHTGHKAITRELLRKDCVSPEIRQQLRRSAEAFFIDGDWVRAIHEHAEALSKTTAVPPFVKELAQELFAEGLIEAIKTTGAGGGDALLAFTPSERHAALADFVTARGGWLGRGRWGAPGLELKRSLP